MRSVQFWVEIEEARRELRLTRYEKQIVDRLLDAAGGYVPSETLCRLLWPGRPLAPTALTRLSGVVLTLNAKLRRRGFTVHREPREGWALARCAAGGAVRLEPQAPHAAPAIRGLWDEDEWVTA